MRRIFVDTGAFVALLVEEDRMHRQAAAFFDAAADDGWQLVTTNAVVVETYSVLLVRARRGRTVAIAFLDAILADESELLAIERVQPGDEAAAVTLVRTHTDKSYSLCDALSFMVMHRLGIEEAIAFDRHFREYGRFTIIG